MGCDYFIDTSLSVILVNNQIFDIQLKERIPIYSNFSDGDSGDENFFQQDYLKHIAKYPDVIIMDNGSWIKESPILLSNRREIIRALNDANILSDECSKITLKYHVYER